MKNFKENLFFDEYIPDFGLPYPDLDSADVSVGAQNRAIRDAWFAVGEYISTAYNQAKLEVDNVDNR